MRSKSVVGRQKEWFYSNGNGARDAIKQVEESSEWVFQEWLIYAYYTVVEINFHFSAQWPIDIIL